jgi:hypothetical protein
MDFGPIALANPHPTHYLALQQGTSTLFFSRIV